MKSLLTPKELAAAIGASESSLRRWVDNGDIRMSRTAGGHRRIPLSEAIQFIRKLGAPIVRPDLLGLGAVTVHGPDARIPDAGPLFDALRMGDRSVARSLVLSWYLEGKSLPALFEGPMRQALMWLGELWMHDERGILEEHRDFQISI